MKSDTDVTMEPVAQDGLLLELAARPAGLDILFRRLAEQLASDEVASSRKNPKWDEAMWDGGDHFALIEEHYRRLVGAFQLVAIAEVSATFDGMRYSPLLGENAARSRAPDAGWTTDLERFPHAGDVEF